MSVPDFPARMASVRSELPLSALHVDDPTHAAPCISVCNEAVADVRCVCKGIGAYDTILPSPVIDPFG